MTDKEAKHKFSADRPITSHKDDLLGVVGFAESLASSIKGWTGRDSLIVALYGQWGSGKTSIKNLAIESLRSDKDNCPSIVEFNPWQWAGQSQLAEGFFQEVGVALGFQQKDKQNKKRAIKWRSYAAYLKMGSFLAGSFRSSIAWLLFIVGFVAAGSALFVDPAHIKTMVVVTGTFALALAMLFKWGGSFVDNLISILEAKSKVQEKSLAENKKELSSLLQKLSQPVLVIIDDVDRLTKEEVKYLFQLIKANADFPNLIYLLLFQRDLIEKHFDPEPEFLEKIVQVGFDIPRIERNRLEKALFNGLNGLLSDELFNKRFNKQRWNNLFVAGLRPFFENLRDVRRFLATFSFHLSLFRNQGSFEVNHVDLIGLEVLRVFVPSVYQRLFGLKSLLTGENYSLFDSDPEVKKGHSKTIENLISLGPENKRDELGEIIKQLFPNVRKFYGGFGSDPDKSYRELNVCHPDVFDRYFHFAISEGDISQADLDRIMSLLGEREALVKELKFLSKKGLLGVFLNRFEAYKEEIDTAYAVPFVTSIFDIGDDLPEATPGLFDESPYWNVKRIIYWHLKKEKDKKRRGQILKEAIEATGGLFLTVRIIADEEYRHIKKGETDDVLLEPGDLEVLKLLCIDKIRQAAVSGELRAHRKKNYIIYLWNKWTPDGEAKRWVEELIQTDDGLLSFLISAVRASYSSRGEEDVRINWYIQFSEIDKYVSIDTMMKKILLLKKEKLTEEELRAVDVFEKAMQRKKDGKSEDRWFNDED